MSDRAAHVNAMLEVSGIVARGEPLDIVLDAIARQAVAVATGARAASIMLIEDGDAPWRIAGAHGLSAGYGDLVRTWPEGPRPGRTLAEQDLRPDRPIVVEDTESDERFAAWRGIARAERFRGFLSVPLAAEDVWLGALNVFRPEPGPWVADEVDVIAAFAASASVSLRLAELLGRQERELAGLRRLVRSLEDQGHERTNRLHTVSGLLALDAVAEARSFLEHLEDAHHDMTSVVARRVAHRVLAGLLLAEMAIAGQRGIMLEIDARTDVEEIPASVGDAQIVTIVGNLLDNALDAVADLAPPRRRVRFSARRGDGLLVVEVRDWGAGLDGAERMFERGVSTKDGHLGLGLTLVRDSVRAAGGTVTARRRRPGSSFVVELPFA